MSQVQAGLVPGFPIEFQDFYTSSGLEKIDAVFLEQLTKCSPSLHDQLLAARKNAPETKKEEAALLISVAPYLDDFIADLFNIKSEMAKLLANQDDLAPLFACKRLFVQRRALKAMTAEEAALLDSQQLTTEMSNILGTDWSELTFARQVMLWLENEEANASQLAIAARYASWALLASDGQRKHASGRLFKVAGKTDPLRLVPVEQIKCNGTAQMAFPSHHLRRREGFSLTDHGTDLAGALDEINYCILCHNQGKDSCSTGLRDKQNGGFSKTAIGAVQGGCPLEERISEMHHLKGKGLSVSAVAMAVIDNAMMAGTGHRICNDCMVACIYTNGNKEPVNVPEAETRILKDVLELPWGFEIYSLLTRWNPLNLRRYLPRPATGRTVLVVGLGPAGYTLAHHLMNDGHAVVAVDGLKIEPLDPEISGVSADGSRRTFRPIGNVADLYENMADRVMAGFGGVAEYGITARWNKNFLKLIRLLLERRQEFLMLGGIRLGSTVSLDEAFRMGFDHIALCMGAGKPTVIDIPNNLARGVRQASDFLMALQLTGAARPNGLANLQMRMPVVVVGGGLTAIDSCTEALAYYPVQVTRFLERYEVLAEERGEDVLRHGYSPEENEIADEFIAHAKLIRAEREAARREGREARILELLKGWGGVTMAYRRKLVESPAYRNHEEINKAMEEGIHIAEGLSPIAVETDQFAHARGLRVADSSGKETVLPARTIIIAAGTVPNTVLAREDGRIQMNGKYFQALDEECQPVTPENFSKTAKPYLLVGATGIESRLSFFGDLHPSYAGNVVSAMASARQGYPVISRILAKASPPAISSPQELFAVVNRDFRAKVCRVTRLAPSIIEVVLEAPAAARSFLPGQFYRLQNFETLAPISNGTSLAMEGLALTGAWVDKQAGLVSLIVLEMGGSSDLCQILRIGEAVTLMGPTGEATEIPQGETVLLAGGGLGNAVLFSIGQALRQAGSKVLYFAGYRSDNDRFKTEEIEAAADLVVWCVDGGKAIVPNRSQDKSFTGNIVEAMLAYAGGQLGEQHLSLAKVNRIIAIGSHRMMQAVARARHNQLAPYLNSDHEAIGSINSPMQCMMKEICAQCLQKHKDTVTGKEWVVFTCAGQDQNLDHVDFDVLHERLGQNSPQEKLTRHWIDHVLRKSGLRG